MNKRNLLSLILVSAIVIFVGLAYRYYREATTDGEPTTAMQQTIEAGKPLDLPEFTLTTEDGKSITAEDLKGKVTVVNFWASWCTICVHEFKDFNAVWDEYRDNKDVTFIFLNATDGQRETKESAKEFIKDQGYNFPIFFDENMKLFRTLGLTGLPDTMILNKDAKMIPIGQSLSGKPYYIQVGAMSADQLRSHIEKALNP